MLIRPVETERGAPVMENEDNVVTQFEFFPKGKEEVPLLGVGVTIGTGIGQLVRVAHTDQVACN